MQRQTRRIKIELPTHRSFSRCFFDLLPLFNADARFSFYNVGQRWPTVAAMRDIRHFSFISSPVFAKLVKLGHFLSLEKRHKRTCSNVFAILNYFKLSDAL